LTGLANFTQIPQKIFEPGFCCHREMMTQR